MKVLEKMEIKALLESYVKTTLQNGLTECDLSYIPYDTIKSCLEDLGYQLSDSPDRHDDVMYTNGWEHDYSMHIWKDGEYTKYYLYGSLYYGNNKITYDDYYGK